MYFGWDVQGVSIFLVLRRAFIQTWCVRSRYEEDTMYATI